MHNTTPLQPQDTSAKDHTHTRHNRPYSQSPERKWVHHPCSKELRGMSMWCECGNISRGIHRAGEKTKWGEITFKHRNRRLRQGVYAYASSP